MPCEFHYAIENCDVVDQNLLIRYRQKLDEWKTWLVEDENSVWHQIRELCWYDATYRIINASRGLAKPREEGWVSLNRTLASFNDQAWLIMMVLGIGRLTDESRKNDVLSIPGLLNDIRNNRS